MISSGSPPNGNPKPPPSMRSSLATLHLQLADQPIPANVHSRRRGRQFLVRADDGLVADEEQAGEFDVDVSWDDDGRVADDLRDRDRDFVAVQLGRPEVEVAVPDSHHDMRVLTPPPAPRPLDLADDRPQQSHRLAA